MRDRGNAGRFALRGRFRGLESAVAHEMRSYNGLYGCWSSGSLR